MSEPNGPRYFVRGAFRTDRGVDAHDIETSLNLAEKRAPVWGTQQIFDTHNDYVVIVTVYED